MSLAGSGAFCGGGTALANGENMLLRPGCGIIRLFLLTCCLLDPFLLRCSPRVQ